MKKTFCLCTVVLMACASATAQQAWTLEDCTRYALEHNITLQKARLQEQQAMEDVKGAKGQLLPSLSASTNQSVGYRPWQDHGTTTVTNGQVNTKVDKTYYNGSYGLNASWTVWNGNKNRNQVKLNSLTQQQAELAVRQTANSIQEQIAQLYIQVLYLNETAKVSEQSLETSRKNEERGKEMLQVGKMSKADVAQLSAQRASDEYTLTETQSNIARYTLQLKQLLELSPNQSFSVAIPATTEEQALATIPALQAVYEQALLTRPEIASSELAIKSSDVSLAIARAGKLPSMSLSGGLGTSTNSLSNNSWSTQLKTDFDASAGITLSIPIFDGRQTKTNANKARLQRQQALLDLEDQQDKLYQTIEGYWLDAQTHQQQLRVAITTEESEQLSFDLLQEQFNLGLKNIVELMTGRDRLLSAQQNRLQSKYQTLLALNMLRFYGGEAMQ